LNSGFRSGTNYAVEGQMGIFEGKNAVVQNQLLLLKHCAVA